MYPNSAEETASKPVQCGFESHHGHYYAYILGMYLGDGHITKMPRTYRLRIYLDLKYPEIIEECRDALSMLYPINKVSLYPGQGNCGIVVVHNSYLSNHFPQHGPGKKHTRSIQLAEWQKDILRDHGLDFLRGCIHSDGCRDLNIVNGKAYPRYSFSNMSSDIKEIVERVARSEGFTPKRMSKGKVITFATRKDVNVLDHYIGPKT